MFNIKDNKRDKVIKIIKGQSNKNYLIEISHTFPDKGLMTPESPLPRDVMPLATENPPCPAFSSELLG